jgi:hypothetical protein
VQIRNGNSYIEDANRGAAWNNPETPSPSMLPLAARSFVMSLARKLALSILPALALALPLAAASSAQANEHGRVERHDDHEDHWSYDHSVHFTHHDHVFVDRHVFIGGYAPVPVVVATPTVSLYYRVGPTSPWIVYGSFGGYGGAQVAAQSLQGYGYQCFIR